MNIFTEYRKGIMFLRIDGSLDKVTYRKLEEEINILINNCGVNNIVINLEEVSKIDMKGISTLYLIYECIKKLKGSIYIYLGCNELKNILKNYRVFNYMDLIDSELRAFDLVRI